MVRSIVLVALLALLAVSLGLPAGPLTVPGSSPAAAAPAARHIESFVIEDAEGAALGLVSWRRRTDLGLLERDVLWRGGTRVLHDEQPTDAVPRLVWRELPIQRRGGRSWMAELVPDQDLMRTQHWGTDGQTHGSVPGGGDATLPLVLVDELRGAQRVTGRLRWVDPLGGRIEDVLLHVRRGTSPRPQLRELVARGLEVCGLPEGTPVRTASIVRADGTIARRYLVGGGEVLAFQFQDGGAWATRVSHERFRYLEDRFGKEPKGPDPEQAVQPR